MDKMYNIMLYIIENDVIVSCGCAICFKHVYNYVSEVLVDTLTGDKNM